MKDITIMRVLKKVRRMGMDTNDGLRHIVADSGSSFPEKQVAQAILKDPNGFDDFLNADGGPGSGNFGHGGRPGQRGGSSEEGSAGEVTHAQSVKNYETAIREVLQKEGIEAANRANHLALERGLIRQEQFTAGAQILAKAFLEQDQAAVDGGNGSGNFGHKGRPGQIGGSGGGGGSKAPKGLSFEQQKARWGAMTPQQYSETKVAEFPDGVNPEVRATFEKAVKAEPAITAAMQRQAEACGAEMDSLEFRVKDGDSYMRKVRKDAKEKGTQLKAANDLFDAVRYTQVSDEKNLVQNAKKTLTNLQAEGYNVIGVKNTWKDPGTAYNGVNVKLRSPDGQQFELQFHTRDSLSIKEKIHKLYEEQRKLPKRDPRYKELDRQMFAISNGQKRPDGIDNW